jgi:hypothetical protein
MLVNALGLPHEAMWDYRLEPAHSALVRVADGTAELVSFNVLPSGDDGGTMHSNP